jgi:hypothetical protein
VPDCVLSDGDEDGYNPNEDDGLTGPVPRDHDADEPVAPQQDVINQAQRAIMSGSTLWTIYLADYPVEMSFSSFRTTFDWENINLSPVFGSMFSDSEGIPILASGRTPLHFFFLMAPIQLILKMCAYTSKRIGNTSTMRLTPYLYLKCSA